MNGSDDQGAAGGERSEPAVGLSHLEHIPQVERCGFRHHLCDNLDAGTFSAAILFVEIVAAWVGKLLIRMFQSAIAERGDAKLAICAEALGEVEVTHRFSPRVRALSKPKTHRLSKEPKVSARHLADYMAASATAQRTIIRDCKYRPIGRIVQHDRAKVAIGRFIRDPDVAAEFLSEEAETLRNMMADDEFSRDVLDHNADYLDRFALVHGNVQMPAGEVLAPGSAPSIELEGVTVTCELQWRMRRQTKTNQIRIGAGALRYAKGKAQSEVVACWHAALIFGYLGVTTQDEEAKPETKLCTILDAYTGTIYPAPTNSVARFNQMRSACATIAERWPNIAAPANAVF